MVIEYEKTAQNNRPVCTSRKKRTGKAILNYWDNYENEHLVPPSMREVSRALGLSVSTVHGYVHQMLEEGIMMQVVPNSARGIILSR